MIKRLLLIYSTIFYRVLFIIASRYLPSLTFSPLLLSLFVLCTMNDLKFYFQIKIFRFRVPTPTMYSGMLPWASCLTSVSFSFLICKWWWWSLSHRSVASKWCNVLGPLSSDLDINRMHFVGAAVVINNFPKSWLLGLPGDFDICVSVLPSRP